jgi:hypothetical protein
MSQCSVVAKKKKEKKRGEKNKRDRRLGNSRQSGEDKMLCMTDSFVSGVEKKKKKNHSKKGICSIYILEKVVRRREKERKKGIYISITARVLPRELSSFQYSPVYSR